MVYSTLLKCIKFKVHTALVGFICLGVVDKYNIKLNCFKVSNTVQHWTYKAFSFARFDKYSTINHFLSYLWKFVYVRLFLDRCQKFKFILLKGQALNFNFVQIYLCKMNFVFGFRDLIANLVEIKICIYI